MFCVYIGLQDVQWTLVGTLARDYLGVGDNSYTRNAIQDPLHSTHLLFGLVVRLVEDLVSKIGI